MNMTPLQRLGLWLAWILFSLIAFAPLGRAQTQVDTPIWLQADSEWNAWSGSVRNDLDPALTQIIKAPDKALHDRLLQELDQMWLLYMSDRNLVAAAERFGAIWTRAFSADSFPALVKTDVYAELHLMRYRLLVEFGNDAAMRLEPKLSPTASVIGRYVSVTSLTQTPMSGELIPGYTGAGLLERAEGIQAMQDLRAQWKREQPSDQGFKEMNAYVEARYGLVGQELRTRVTNELRMMNANQIVGLGRGAIGVVASMAIAATGVDGSVALPEKLTPYEVLKMYLQIDRAGALELFVDWYPRANQEWRWALAYVAVGNLKPDWVDGPRQVGAQDQSPWKLLVDPHYADMAALLINDPDRVNEGLFLSAPLAPQNQIQGELAQRLAELVVGPNRSLAGMTLQALATPYVVPSLIPIFERGTASPFADVRAMCGARLLDMGALAEVRRLATHTDPSLRALAITAMGPVQVIRLEEGQRSSVTELKLRADSTDIARIASLLKSDLRSKMLAQLDGVVFEEGSVDALIHSDLIELRKRGLMALAKWPASEVTKWLPQLLNDPDPAFRRALIPTLKGRSYTPEWDLVSLRTIMVGLAGDAVASVRAAVDATMTNFESPLGALTLADWAYIMQGVLPARAAVTQVSPFASPDGRSNWHMLPMTWFADYADAPFLLEFAIEQSLGDLVLAMMGSVHREGQSKGDVIATLMQLEPANRRALYNLSFEPWMVAEMGTQWTACRDLVEGMHGGKVPDIEAVRMEFEATKTPASWAVESVFKGRDEAARQIWRSLLEQNAYALNLRLQAGRTLQGYDESVAERYLPGMWTEATALQGTARAEALGLINTWLKVCRNPAQWMRRLDLQALTPLERSHLYLVFFAFPEGQDVDLMLDVLRDLLNMQSGGAQGFDAVREVLEGLKLYTVDQAGRALVIQAAGMEPYAVRALEVMEQAPHPDYLATAQACFEKPGSMDRLSWATRILMSLPDASSLPILEAWRAPSGLSGLRFNALSTIQARTQPKPEGLPSQKDAVAELLEMLKSKDAFSRGAAARGLARLGQLEALPVLITAAANEADADVKTKIQAAIEELLELGAK